MPSSTSCRRRRRRTHTRSSRLTALPGDGFAGGRVERLAFASGGEQLRTEDVGLGSVSEGSSPGPLSRLPPDGVAGCACAAVDLGLVDADVVGRLHQAASSRVLSQRSRSRRRTRRLPLGKVMHRGPRRFAGPSPASRGKPSTPATTASTSWTRSWGHLTVKMSGHPPFGAQVILNGPEYVACQARAEGIGFTKEGNCFTGIADPQRLAQVADALSQPAAIGRLGRACDRWIYSACRCFGLDLAEQARSGFAYNYSIYQAEYSRNLLFRSGGQMEDLVDRILDRTRSRLDIPALRVLFGLKNRPHANRAAGPPAQEIVIEKPQYGLAWFQIRFGLLQLKAYTKREHVLRFEATVHNTKHLRCRRSLDTFPEIITRLAGTAERFATTLDCADISFLPDGLLDQLPLPARVGGPRTGGIDPNKPRIRAALAAALALAAAPHGFTVAEHTAKVCSLTRQDGATPPQGAYDRRQ